ncbi:MAG TPA: glycoside hydrolase family 3 N-terminal domain-containing protein, partial [Chloroflexota bacterium]|nr:glycoside hydrolase family 3 N-terminal domain-containing protein [Chloroflexota bacterium]
PGTEELIAGRAIGGVILYGRNCTSAGQVKTLIGRLQRAAPYPLLVCTDQEGGAVVRIAQGVPVFPSEASYGQAGSAARVYRDATATATALRALGLTLNLAPVVDVLGNPRSPIGSRSYGADPNLVARLSSAAIRGYQDHGLRATAKHFIGLGHTSIDSHQALPSVPLSLAALERDDLIPFRSAVAAGVSTMLVAHVALPLIDRSGRPASLSPTVIGGIIRGRLKFKGTIMTDSLLMGAVPGGGGQAAVEAFQAGADLLLFGQSRDFPAAVIDDAIARLLHAVQRGTIAESRIDASLRRARLLKGV